VFVAKLNRGLEFVHVVWEDDSIASEDYIIHPFLELTKGETEIFKVLLVVILSNIHRMSLWHNRVYMISILNKVVLLEVYVHDFALGVEIKSSNNFVFIIHQLVSTLENVMFFLDSPAHFEGVFNNDIGFRLS